MVSARLQLTVGAADAVGTAEEYVVFEEEI